jgi:hypothetical protein
LTVLLNHLCTRDLIKALAVEDVVAGLARRPLFPYLTAKQGRSFPPQHVGMLRSLWASFAEPDPMTLIKEIRSSLPTIDLDNSTIYRAASDPTGGSFVIGDIPIYEVRYAEFAFYTVKAGQLPNPGVFIPLTEFGEE